MAFDWSKYLDLARELAQRGSDEAALRTAVSRAYYAVFCSARDLLASEGSFPPRGLPVHKWVWDEFKSHPDAGRQLVGSTADGLRRARSFADYEGQATGWDTKARVAIATASNLLISLKGLTKP